MFGKPYAAYVLFQRGFLIAIAVLGFLRLGLSLGGLPNSVVRYFSMTVVGFIGIFYYGLQVRRRGFGGYRHLLPLIFNQGLIANGIAILGIGLSAVGLPNAYDALEFRGPFATPDTTPLTHALAHLFLGTTMGTLVGWCVGAVLMWIGGGRPRK